MRVVLRDSTGAVFLFRTEDPAMPETGTWWELPGGGVEAGETPAQTAVREVFEETGFVLDETDIGPPTWRRDATYLRRRHRYLQHEVVVGAVVEGRAPEPSAHGRTDLERIEYVGYRWWPVAELAASRERFFPGRLPALIESFLAGDPIDEPFETWN